MKTAVVCVYKSGGDYDEHALEYVNRLYYSVSENMTTPYDFHVITDMPGLFYGIIEYGIIPMISDLQKWHSKFEIFRQDLWESYDRVLYLDIDSAAVGNIDDLATADVDFALLSDIYHRDRAASGVILYTPHPKYQALFDRMDAHPPKPRMWDIYPMLDMLADLGVEPERLDRFKIYSWKLDLFQAKTECLKPMPADSQIIVWHGRPRPHDVNWLLPDKQVKTTQNE